MNVLFCGTVRGRHPARWDPRTQLSRVVVRVVTPLVDEAARSLQIRHGHNSGCRGCELGIDGHESIGLQPCHRRIFGVADR